MSIIHEVLPRVMAEIGGIGKDQKNAQQRYNFRGIDDVLNHCQPALIKHGVSCSVSVTGSTHKEIETPKGFRTRVLLDMEVTFSATDGSSVTNRTVGEAMDYNGDKATNKAMAAAMKYAFFFGLVIPVDAKSIDDSDRDHKPDPQTAPLVRKDNKTPVKTKMATQKQCAAIHALLSAIGKPKDAHLDSVNAWLKKAEYAPVESTKDLNHSQASQIIDKLQVKADEMAETEAEGKD